MHSTEGRRLADELIRNSTVVGIDGSQADEAALQWAVRDAAARRGRLRVVSSYAWELRNPWERTFAVDGPELKTLQTKAERLVAGVVERISYNHPTLNVTGAAIEGGAVDIFMAESEHADVLVLGSRSLDKVHSRVLGSVSATVAARAHCPVAVVHCEDKSDPDAEVLVGVHDGSNSDGQYGFAFEYAHRHRLGLRAVMCWWPGLGEDPMRVADILDRAQVALEATLRPWQDKYPDVRATADVSTDHAVERLSRSSLGQAAVVVGSRGRHALAGSMLGSVSQGVLHHAACPVIVVPVHS